MFTHRNIEDLTEVKKGQTGRGLLIERDGRVLGNEDLVRQIREDVAHHHEFVIPDNFTVNAVFQKYGIKNANGRVYPESVLKREVEKYVNDRVNSRSAVGALDHPSSTTLSGHDVSHVITELHWVGRTLVGTMDLHLSPGYRKYGICSTSGDLAANMILDGIQIGVSSRAVGSVEERLGVLEVGDDLELVSWDIVLEPSTPGAFVSGNMQDLERFIEANDSRDENNLVNEKLARVKSILM